MHASPLTIAVGCFAAGSLVAVGIAQATTAPQSIPDSGTGVITSCVKKKGGQVRFIDAQAGKRCKKSERRVTFSQTGPRGAAGSQGAAGPQGPQGERGPSNAFVKANAANVSVNNLLEILPGNPLRNSVATLTVPAGSYTVTGSTRMRKTNNTTDAISCSIHSPNGTVSGTVVTHQFAPASDNDYRAFAVTAGFTTNVESSVILRCNVGSTGFFNGAAESGGATIVATRVADLTVQ